MKSATIPHLLFADAARHPRPDALCMRHSGRWLQWSTEQCLDEVRWLTAALEELGIGPGTGVGIVAPSCPRWIFTDIASQILGAWTVPMFANIHHEHFRFQVEDAAVHTLLMQSPGELAPELLPHLSNITHLICLQDSHQLPGALDFEALLHRGQQLYNAEAFETRLNALDPATIATLIYTSGTTGLPKGAELTHSNIVGQVHAAIERFGIGPADRAVSALPIAHVFERMVSLAFLSCGMSVWFADDPKQLGVILQEVKPTAMTVVPRLVERVYEKMNDAAAKASGIRRILLKSALRAARTANPDSPALLHPLWEKLVYGKLRSSLGGQLRLLVSGSSALNAFLARFFLNVGIPIYEGYGLTECSPVLSACYPGHNKLGTVGPAFPGVELRIAPHGEIQARTPGLMRGYHNNPSASAACLTEDGWFRTGDLGSVDADGFLRIEGRCKDLLKTSTGKYVSPLPIELALARHPLIESALVVADNRKFASALLFTSPESLQRYLRREENFDLKKAVSSKRVKRALDNLCQKVNRGLNPWERIVRRSLIPSPPTVESGMLTPTLKLRRAQVESAYVNIIDEFYAGHAPE